MSCWFIYLCPRIQFVIDPDAQIFIWGNSRNLDTIQTINMWVNIFSIVRPGEKHICSTDSTLFYGDGYHKIFHFWGESIFSSRFRIQEVNSQGIHCHWKRIYHNQYPSQYCLVPGTSCVTSCPFSGTCNLTSLPVYLVPNKMQGESYWHTAFSSMVLIHIQMNNYLLSEGYSLTQSTTVTLKLLVSAGLTLPAPHRPLGKWAVLTLE